MHTLWITRVPATLNEVKDLLDADVVMKTCSDERYSYYETTSSYGGIDQKWVLIESDEMKKRKEKTFDKSIEKEMTASLRSLNKLKRTEYACEEDARNAAELWIKEHKRFRFSNISIEKKSRRKNGKVGRPKKGEELQDYYSVIADIEIDETVVKNESDKLGRFVLATNDLSLTPEEILSYYKSQSTIERGFRFLKDNSFHVSEVYLKKESRIEALSMIMVLCLFLYSIAQWKLRTKLKETGTFVKNQVKKPVQNPTMRWIFFLFRGVAEVEIVIEGAVEAKVANMKDELWQILDLMGENCRKYYM
jgi:transposase